MAFFAILLSVVTMACVRSTFPLTDLSKANASFIDPDTSTRTPIINDCGVDEGCEDWAMVNYSEVTKVAASYEILAS